MIPNWIRRRLNRLRGDDGWTLIEAVSWTLVLVLVLSIVALFGRIAQAQGQAANAASDAARAASLQRTFGAAQDAATTAAQQSLSGAGISCAQFDVAVSGNVSPGGMITVTVACTTSLSDLAIAGVPGSKTLTGVASAPVDVTRTAA